MKGVYLRFYVHEGERHAGRLMYEWLLETGKKAGIPGGSAFRAMAGYGRHGVLHEQHFFELAGELPVEVEFLLSETQAEALLDALRDEGVSLFYAKASAEFGVLGSPAVSRS